MVAHKKKQAKVGMIIFTEILKDYTILGQEDGTDWLLEWSSDITTRKNSTIEYLPAIFENYIQDILSIWGTNDFSCTLWNKTLYGLLMREESGMRKQLHN